MYHAWLTQTKTTLQTTHGRKESREGKMKGRMSQWLLAVTSGLAAKGLAKGLEVVGMVWFTALSPLPLSFLPCVVHKIVLLCIMY